MIQENEMVMFIIGAGVFLFTVAYRVQLKRIPEWRILISAFRILVAAWLLTILEGFFWGETLNYLEHFCYACSTVLMVIWCWKIAFNRKLETK